MQQSAESLEVGAATRISELMDYLGGFGNNVVAEGLVDHLKELAGGHVRNWGGCNLVMAQRFAFESDLATIQLGAGASVKIVSLTGSGSSVTEISPDKSLAKQTLGEDSLCSR